MGEAASQSNQRRESFRGNQLRRPDLERLLLQCFERNLHHNTSWAPMRKGPEPCTNKGCETNGFADSRYGGCLPASMPVPSVHRVRDAISGPFGKPIGIVSRRFIVRHQNANREPPCRPFTMSLVVVMCASASASANVKGCTGRRGTPLADYQLNVNVCLLPSTTRGWG